MRANHTSRCADCWQEEEEVIINTPYVESIFAKGQSEAGLIIEVGDHFRSRMGADYTTRIGTILEQCLVHVLLQRSERKEGTAI